MNTVCSKFNWKQLLAKIVATVGGVYFILFILALPILFIHYGRYVLGMPLLDGMGYETYTEFFKSFGRIAVFCFGIMSGCRWFNLKLFGEEDNTRKEFFWLVMFVSAAIADRILS